MVKLDRSPRNPLRLLLPLGSPLEGQAAVRVLILHHYGRLTSCWEEEQ
jgi:hypothetical protein